MAETVATLNGIKLDLETISDSFDKALAEHHIPFTDRTLIQDMGLKARRIRLRCYFWADTYQTHKDLLQLLWDKQDFELNHPEYGLLRGKIDNVHVRHDHMERVAEIDIDFISGQSTISVSASTDIKGDAEQLAADGFLDVEKKYRDALVESSVLPIELVDKVLDPELDIIDQITGYGATVRAYAKKLDTMVHDLNSVCAGITAPVDSLVGTVELGLAMPGRIIGTIAGMVEKMTVRFITLKNAPGRFMSSIFNQLSRFTYPGNSTLFGRDSSDSAITLADDLAANAYLATSSIGLSTALADIYDEDEAIRNAQVQAEQVRVFDSLGRVTGDIDINYAMTIGQIEETLSLVRTVCDLAVAVNRDTSAIKLLSDKLLEHVVQIKVESEKIIHIEVDNQTPLHLVCLKYGLPYRAAERIMLINKIRNPNRVQGSIDIYES